MVKVLFVCTGNICRSPTAEGIMRARLAAEGLQARVETDSAGTHGYHAGEPPDRRSIATAFKHGVDISGLRARQVAKADFSDADIIAVMERSHERHLLNLCPPGLEGRIRMLLDFAPDCELQEVPDPYYDDNGFEDVYRLIEQGVCGLVAHIRRTFTVVTE